MKPTSPNRLKQAGIWAVAIAFGLIFGRMVHSAVQSYSEMRAERDGANQGDGRSRFDWRSPMSESSRYLWRETAKLRDPETYKSEVDRMYREARSPLRVVSVHSHRIQQSTFEEWKYLLAEGEVDRNETIREVGDYLARLDTQEAVNFVFTGPYNFKHLEHFYAFRDSVFDAVVELDPMLLYNTLSAKNKEGFYMDNSRYFSEAWAKRDPVAVAERFDELQRLRNMSLEGPSAQIPYDEFAGILMKSWVQKDIEAAEAFVASQPEGAKREALRAGFVKWSEKFGAEK